MKYLFKLILSMLLCGLLILSGCGTPTTSLPSELRGPDSNYPNNINIIAPDFFYMTGAKNADQMKKQWLDEMSQRYGVNLNIISNSFKDSENNDYSASDQVYDVLKSATTFNGLISVKSSSLRLGLFYDTLLPLEDYLADNSTWNALPEEFKSLFAVDGHIYGIPTSVFRGQYARVIHDEALAQTGIPVTDLDSFREFAVAFAKKTGNPAIMSLNVSEVKDILNAFGLYPGEQSTSFGYDPTEGCYVDFMTKSAAVDAFEYLRELYKAGAINLSYQKDMAKFFSGLIASDFRQFRDFSNCTEVVTLNPAYPQTAFTITNGFAMTKDTTQPKETLNFFINMLFGSEQNYLECWLGSSENYMLNSDGTITVEMPQDSKGKFVYPCIPDLTGGLSELFPFSDANIFFSQNGVISTEKGTGAGEYNFHFKEEYDSLKNGTVVQIPPSYKIIKSATYDANKDFTDKWFKECFENAITNSDITVQQAIDDYLGSMLNIGGNQMLDEMNAAIGKKTAYYYG